MTFKTLDDVIGSDFYNLKKPAKPDGAQKLGIWKLNDTYNITTSVKARAEPGYYNFAKLANPKSARDLADSLASKFGYPSLLDWLTKQAKSCYDVKEDKDKVTATYNLGNSTLFNCYDRIITYDADKKTGNVTITYKCNKAIPEKTIAKDLYKLRKALGTRWNYFVENAKADAKAEAPAEADAKTDAKTKDKTPSESYEGIPKEHLDIFKQNYEALKADAAKVVNYLKNPRQFYDEQIAPQLAAGTPT